MIELATTNDHAIMTSGPLDRNPAAVYLARLKSPSGRRTQRQALDTMAGIFSSGAIADCFSFPWQSLRYQHTAAINTRLQETYAPATVRKYQSALRGVLKECWRLELIGADDYARAVDLAPVIGEKALSGRALASGEIAALLNACAVDLSPAGARDAAIIAVLAAAGLRREEAAKLTLADYDQETGSLLVHGKRSKDRTVYIENGAADALADWLDIRGQEPGPLFVPINKGGKLQQRSMTNQAIYNLLEKRGADAKVKKFSPHDLRRTFVSELLDAGADISTVAKLAGHSSVTTTGRYDRRGEHEKRKAARMLHVPYQRRNKLQEG